MPQFAPQLTKRVDGSFKGLARSWILENSCPCYHLVQSLSASSLALSPGSSAIDILFCGYFQFRESLIIVDNIAENKARDVASAIWRKAVNLHGGDDWLGEKETEEKKRK